MKMLGAALALVLAGIPGAASADPGTASALPLGPDPLRVVDADGRTLGRLFQYVTITAVQLSLDGERYGVMLTPALQADGNFSPVGLDFRTGDPMYFTTPDCGGRVFAGTYTMGMRFAMVTVDTASGQVLLYAGGTSSKMLLAQSYRDATGCHPMHSEQMLVPLEAPADITRRFTRPFHIE